MGRKEKQLEQYSVVYAAVYSTLSNLKTTGAIGSKALIDNNVII